MPFPSSCPAQSGWRVKVEGLLQVAVMSDEKMEKILPQRHRGHGGRNRGRI
jgi:hypothetical protein